MDLQKLVCQSPNHENHGSDAALFKFRNSYRKMDRPFKGILPYCQNKKNLINQIIS